jgi:hypothetical protein
MNECVLCIHCSVSPNSLGTPYNISHHQILFNTFTSHCITPVQCRECSFQATGWTIRGSIRGEVRETLLLSKTSRPETKPTQLPNRDFFLKAKWPEGEADHSSPSSAQVKDEWIYTATHSVFMEWIGKPLPFSCFCCTSSLFIW